jgi:hypothetical protein
VVTWAPVPEDEAARTWDGHLQAFPDRSYVHAFGWGRYKATQGWRPIRAEAHDERGALAGMVQALVRTYPAGVGVIWCPGGHVGPLDLWNRDLVGALARAGGMSRTYCRVSFMRPLAAPDVQHLQALGWRRPSRPVSAPATFIWDLPASDEATMAGLTGNWRHNLQRALRRNLRVVEWRDPSPSAVAGVFGAMSRYKRLEMTIDPAAVSAMLGSLDGRLLVYACENDAGTPIAVRGCVVDGERAWDLLAATSPEGRQRYASYAVLWALIRGCRARGVTRYDLGGVDAAAAPGVYTFKRGTGAREQQHLGEWESSTSRLLASVVSVRLRLSPRAALA